jgi:hypothetical protein
MIPLTPHAKLVEVANQLCVLVDQEHPEDRLYTQHEATTPLYRLWREVADYLLYFDKLEDQRSIEPTVPGGPLPKLDLYFLDPTRQVELTELGDRVRQEAMVRDEQHWAAEDRRLNSYPDGSPIY